MDQLSSLAGYFREVSRSVKFQFSATVTFGISLLFLWLGKSGAEIFFTILFLFPTCMLIWSLCEKVMSWRERKRQRKAKEMKRKLGLLDGYEFTDKLSTPWADKNFNGLGWQILSNDHTRSAFLTTPVCLNCKTDLITKTNDKCDGFYLECTDCKQRFEVGDIGETRALAAASLQGSVRQNPEKFFSIW